MADIEVNTQYLLDLKEQVRELRAVCQALDDFFVIGADRIAREPDVEQLRTLATRLKHQLQEAIISEDSARSSSAKFDAGTSVGNLFATGIGIVTGNRGLVEGAERLQKKRAGRQHCFGMIVVCVGIGGLPDDIQVISISGRAREKNLPESNVIHKIHETGAILFTPDRFWQLIEEVVHNIQEGKIRLPIPLKYLEPRRNIAGIV